MIKKDIGFVLRRYNFRETSLITSLYTYKYGKIRGIFKGFYTHKKEFASSLDTFSLNEFVFYPKKSEIWLVSHVDLISNFSFLRKSVSKAMVGGLFLNLVDKAMQLWDANQYIFTLLNNCLNLLDEERERKALYIFLIKFLTFSGFKPEFNSCLSCKNTLAGGQNLFSVSKGGLVCKDCAKGVSDIRRISPQALQSLIYIQNNDFPLIRRLNPNSTCEGEIIHILKEFLSYRFEFDVNPVRDIIF